MQKNPMLIVMLTHNDRTVINAKEVFEEAKESHALYWGMKEEGISFDEMLELFSYMKKCGKTTVLEVVAYSEEEGLKGAETAVNCGCDILMGTKFYDSINEYCKMHNLKYMPFAGQISERPSVLSGEIEDIISEAEEYISKGVYGIDLLGYRYTGDALKLNQSIASNIDAPICLAGSVNSYDRLDEIIDTGCWAFTIGGAFFENIFGSSHLEQINKICDYIKK